MARDDDFDFTDDDFDDEDDKPKAKKKPEESEEERIGREITEAAQREPFEPEPDPDEGDDTAKAETGDQEAGTKEERQTRSQKRIDQLVREREEERRRNAQMQDEIRQLRGEVSKVSGAISEREVEAKSADIDGKLGDLRKQYRDAIEAGDTDKQIELNEQILDARMEKRDFDRRVKEQKEKPNRAPDQRRGETEANRQPQPQAKGPELSPEGHKWIGRNADWFLDPKFANEHNDTREIDVGLYNEWVQSGKLEKGKMPNDPEYFRELERRLFSKHPHLQPKGGSPGATTAPQGRSAAGKNGRGNSQYKFNRTEAQQMVKMGLDPSSERDRKYWQRERKGSASA